MRLSGLVQRSAAQSRRAVSRGNPWVSCGIGLARATPSLSPRTGFRGHRMFAADPVTLSTRHPVTDKEVW